MFKKYKYQRGMQKGVYHERGERVAAKVKLGESRHVGHIGQLGNQVSRQVQYAYCR